MVSSSNFDMAFDAYTLITFTGLKAEKLTQSTPTLHS